MPTATITVDAGGAGTMTRVRTVTGPHLTRFIAAVRKAYNVPQGFTDIQALEMWADFIFDEARSTVRGQEQATAAAGITDVDFTP
jgi:hypothetical protein